MESSLKLVGTLIILTLVLGIAFNLINSFQQYSIIHSLANDLNNLGIVMKSLKEISDYDSWRKVVLTVPSNYTLFFNNLTNNLEVHGSKEFNITVNNNILYALNLSSGVHQIQLYYGPIQFSELKNQTLVFK